MEKRQHRRIPLRRSVHLRGRGGEQTLESSDFSLSGMAMISQRPVQVGEKVWLQFAINTLGEACEMNVQAEIRHVDQSANSYRVGVNFLEPH